MAQERGRVVFNTEGPQAHSSSAEDGWRLEQVGLQRGARPVFEGLQLHLPQMRIGLIGHNGAGKSSLLRMLSGLELPQQGRITRNGQPHMGVPSRAVALMFQNPDDQIIFPTVEEELALSWQSAHGGDRKAAKAGARTYLATRGLGDWAERAISTLSQGQRQWVCWMALQVAQPQVLLLDEPFASLDLAGQLALAADIAACTQQVLLSTHVLEHVRDWPRVLWMEAGRIRMDGPGQQVCAAYEAEVYAQWQAKAAQGIPVVGAQHG